MELWTDDSLHGRNNQVEERPHPGNYASFSFHAQGKVVECHTGGQKNSETDWMIMDHRNQHIDSSTSYKATLPLLLPANAS